MILETVNVQQSVFLEDTQITRAEQMNYSLQHRSADKLCENIMQNAKPVEVFLASLNHVWTFLQVSTQHQFGLDIKSKETVQHNRSRKELCSAGLLSKFSSESGTGRCTLLPEAQRLLG